jgi:hypothetical protein
MEYAKKTLKYDFLATYLKRARALGYLMVL